MGDMYLEMPLDREMIQEKKIARMQREIAELENRIHENVRLRHKLEDINDAEKDRAERMIDKMKDRHMVLKDEIDRIYKHSKGPVVSPFPSQLVEDVISRRTKEFSEIQQQKTMQTKFLMAEKQRLQIAQDRLRQKRLSLQRLPTPDEKEDTFDKRTPRLYSAHSAGSLLNRTIQRMPQTVDHIWKLKEDLYHDYESKRKPYNGELGLQTYQPWQREDYILVRRLVEDIADDFIEKYIPPDYSYMERDIRRAMQLAQDKEWVATAEALSEKKAVQLVAEELLLEVTKAVMKRVSAEVLHVHGTFKNRADVMLMSEIERVTTGLEKGRDQTDPAYNLVTKTYFSLQHNRNTNRRDVWTHSQFLHRLPESQPVVATALPVTAPPPVMDEIDRDAELITFNHLHPTNLKMFEENLLDTPEVKHRKQCAVRYRKREVEFWIGIKPGLLKISLPSICVGVKCLQPSIDHSFMAVGTVHGDILIYNVQLEVWSLIRLAHNSGGGNDSILHMSWSLDRTRLTAVNQSGTMQIWGFNGPPVNKKEVSTFNLQSDSHGNMPQQLQVLGSMDADRDDFALQQGSLSEAEVLTGRHLPTKATFFPSFTFFGFQTAVTTVLYRSHWCVYPALLSNFSVNVLLPQLQFEKIFQQFNIIESVIALLGNPYTCQLEHSVCAVLDNGDMLKINLEPLTSSESAVDQVINPDAPRIFHPNIYDENHGVNLVGQNLEAELFRQHRHPIVHLGFVDNISSMVSVDQEGYINIWKYDLTKIADFGYFVPAKKYKLDFNKIVYVPESTEKSKIIFTDAVTSKERTQADIAKERAQVQITINKLLLEDPWHDQKIPEKNLITCIYAPKGGVKDSGAMFHIVTRHLKTQQLSSYILRMYKPVKVKSTKLLAVCQSPSGHELVFVLLFPEHTPKDPHITVLVLDLMTMALREYRRDIYLSQEEYTQLLKEDIFSCDMTRVLGPTGAEYLIIIYNGLVRAVSLTTGNLVLRTENLKKSTGFIGCAVDERQLTLPKTSHVKAVCYNGRICTTMFDRNSVTMQVLQLADTNEHETRRLMWKSFQMWEKSRRVAPEMRVDRESLSLSDWIHSEVAMRRIILDLIDERIFNLHKGENKTEENARTVRDNIEFYSKLQTKVNVKQK